MPGQVFRDMSRLISAVAAAALLTTPPVPAAGAAVDPPFHASFHRAGAILRALGFVLDDAPALGCASLDSPRYPVQITYDDDDPSQFSRVVFFTTLPPAQVGARVLILHYLDRPTLRQRALLTIVAAESIPRASDALFVLGDLDGFLENAAAEHDRTGRLTFDRTIRLADVRVMVEVNAGTPGKLHVAVVRRDFGDRAPCGLNQGWDPPLVSPAPALPPRPRSACARSTPAC